jgi:hypothetical protein
MWQREGDGTEPESDIATDGGTTIPLDDVEIDELCERINCEDDEEDEKTKLLRAIVAEVEAVRAKPDDEEDSDWFLRFPFGYYNSDDDHYGVCWSNLAMLIDRAQKLLQRGDPLSSKDDDERPTNQSIDGRMRREGTTEKPASVMLIETVESTGGVISYEDGTHAPAGDPDWIDLGDAYLRACLEHGREPVIVREEI